MAREQGVLTGGDKRRDEEGGREKTRKEREER